MSAAAIDARGRRRVRGVEESKAMTLRIAAVQAESKVGDVGANVEVAARWAQKAVDAGAQLVVFPEAFTTGYDIDVFESAAPSSDEYGWLRPLQLVVDETGVTIVVNTALRTGRSLRLTDLVIAPETAPREVYSKQHLYPLETELFEPGDAGSSIRLNGVEVALSVCYDANFPEHAAAAAADGAIVYLNSGAYFPGGEHRRNLHYASRALDNGMYVMFSGLVGRPHRFIGGTAAYDPLGRVIERLGVDEGMVVVDVDPSIVAQVRQDQRMWRDRRADLGMRTHHHLGSHE